MTLRTTSATRRTVVSRSSEVASTSATSSSSDSTGKRSGLASTESIGWYDSSRVPRPLAQRNLGLKEVLRLDLDALSALSIPAAQCKRQRDCDIFPHSRVRSRPQIHRES